MSPSDEKKRSVHRSRAPLVERVAERLAQESQTTPGLDRDTATASAHQLMDDAAPRRPVRTAASSERVDIDIHGLQRAGYLIPNQGRSHLAEEFRLIKYEVLLNISEQRVANANLVMVTSANPGEGKTFTAVNLAMSLAAERDNYVLLVDADVARPQMFELMGLEPHKGLLDLLKDPDLDLSDVILRTNVDRLSLIGPGLADDLSVELFNSERMRRVTTELASRYPDRVIVFDSPPLLAAVEPTVLSKLTGHVLFVVEANRTKRREIETAVELLREDCELGFVLNRGSGMAASSYSYYSDYYRKR